MGKFGTYISRFKTLADHEQYRHHATDLMPQESTSSDFKCPKFITIIPAGNQKILQATLGQFYQRKYQ
jgi:hypothetical protein